MEERLSIDTPESVSLSYQVAGVGSRFIAALVDAVIVFLAVIAFSRGLGLFSRALVRDLGVIAFNGLLAVYILGIFALTWGYYIFFELVWNGQTPGKRWAGLRVIRTDGTPITVVDSLIRNLVRIIDFLPFYYALGLLTMFLNSQSRRLGDLAAGTLVVREQRDVTLDSVRRQARQPHPPPRAGRGVTPLSEADYRLVADFVARREELPNRGPLALRIATAIADRLDLPAPTSAEEAEALLDALMRPAPGADV